jgi:hypothetical protein
MRRIRTARNIQVCVPAMRPAVVLAQVNTAMQIGCACPEPLQCSDGPALRIG